MKTGRVGKCCNATTDDRQRDLTAFEHLLTDYQQGITEVTDEHYMDFLRHVHPELFTERQEIAPHLVSVRNRHEHAHVWNSETFLEFLKKSFLLLNIQATCLFEVTGTQNQYEYFSVWQKG